MQQNTAASPLYDTRLSFRARAVWVLLDEMAGPEREVLSAFQRLRSLSDADGQQAVRTALGELEKLGYLSKRDLRTPSGRRAGTAWLLHDQPVVGDAAA